VQLTEDRLLQPFLQGAMLMVGLLAAIFAMHLPVIMSLMLMDPIEVTADDTCQEIIRQ